MDDSGPDLDSLIDRMLTLTPNMPSPSEMMKELERLDGERERSQESEMGGGEESRDSDDVPPELPPKQRPAGLQPNGDLPSHLGENGGELPSQEDWGEAPAPKVPPRKKINKEKDSDSVSTFHHLFRTLWRFVATGSRSTLGQHLPAGQSVPACRDL